MLRQHETQIRVRYPETDPMGYLHHANYLSYFEIGRTELLRASGGNYRQMEESGLFAVVVRVDVRYRKPARYDDMLTLRTTIVSITLAKIEHHYELFHEDELLATAKITLALINGDGKVCRVPEWMQVEEME